MAGRVVSKGLALALCVLMAGPALSADRSAAFKAPPMAGAKPWTHERFDDAAENFAFAIVGDLESGYRPGVFEVAAAQLALLRPAFVLTVGDMIDGGKEDEARLRAEWDEFDARLKVLNAPFFHLGGNHDLTNPTQRKVWEQRYGKRYYHFSYKGVLFLVMDTEDYSQGRMEQIYRQRAEYIALRKTDPAKARALPYATLMEARVGEVSADQSAYFEKVLADNPKARWTFVLMHKPAWRRTDGHGLERLEMALKGRPHTVLNGHVHRYGYEVRGGVDHITLGTTGGERGFDGSKGAMDHMMWVTMTKDGPSIANLRLDGVLDKAGEIPAGGAKLCLDHGGPNCPK